MIKILNKTLGLISPRWRTFGEWLDVYDGIIGHRGYSNQTLKNKRTYISHIRSALGLHTIRSLQPTHLTDFISEFLPDRASTARKLVMELRDIFSEAIQNGWVDKNPTLDVFSPNYSVKRQPMTLKIWVAMHESAMRSSIKWVAPALELALVTGRWRAEIAKMRFDHIVEDEKHGPLLIVGKANDNDKTVGIPLALRLRVVEEATGAVLVDMSVGEVIQRCRDYAKAGDTLVRKSSGKALVRPEMLSYRFEECIKSVGEWPDGSRPSFDECRSLSSRLYRDQGLHAEVPASGTSIDRRGALGSGVRIKGKP
jgi:hypothetical protein